MSSVCYRSRICYRRTCVFYAGDTFVGLQALPNDTGQSASGGGRWGAEEGGNNELIADEK